MLELEQELAQRLRRCKVRIDVPDGDTVVLRNVPANERFFNKPRTNLLLQRPREGMPFLVCVDEDLEYHGEDGALARTFAAAPRERGWRVLFPGTSSPDGLQTALEDALALLGFDGAEPEMRTGTRMSPGRPAQGAMLETYGRRLPAGGPAEPAVGRSEEIDEVCACLLESRPRMPVVVGESGAGKTHLIGAVASRLRERQVDGKQVNGREVVLVSLAPLLAGALFDAERDNLFAGLLKEAVQAAPATVIALENLELGLREAPHGGLLLVEALDKGAMLIGSTLPAWRPLLSLDPLARRVHPVELAPMSPEQASEALLAQRDRIAAHHGVDIGEPLARVVVERSMSLAGHLPAKAIALADAAAARAALAGAREVEVYHVYLAAAGFAETEAAGEAAGK